MEKLDQ
jgi:hypothetical protein